MKSIIDLIRGIKVYEIKSEELPEIYCDLDQVLVNFYEGADAAVKGNFLKMDTKKKWGIINQVKDFWVNLNWMPGAKKLYQKVSKYNLHILSAFNTNDPNSKTGKMKWVQKNINVRRGNVHLVLRSQKQNYATTNQKPNVLIDDFRKNILEWEAKGGIGIYHTSVDKTMIELRRLGFK
tara:strand:+ start:218 stop:751 length:534 start_codon:yes stop_codon:yes gene_type:complete